MTKLSRELLRRVIDTQFACGEWIRDDDESYRATSRRAGRALRAFVARINQLEARPPRRRRRGTVR